MPVEPVVGARSGGAVADIVRAFQGGDLVRSIPQQVMGMEDIIGVIRDNIPSSANLTDEENIEDLKNSLKATKESISNNFNDLVQIVENTVKDEEIREDALNLVNNLKHEMSDFVEIAKEKVSDVLNFKSLEEE